MININSKLETSLVWVISIILAAITIWLKLQVTPSWFDGTLEKNHNLLLQFKFTNNEQSRLLQFYIPQLIKYLLGVTTEYAYIIQRFLFTTATLIISFYFNRKWLNSYYSIICVLILGLLIIPNTFLNHLQESAPLLALTFLIGFWTIREQRTVLFALVLLIGAINNETMLFMPAVYFFYNFKKWNSKEIINLCMQTLLIASPAFIVVGFIRYINIDRPHLGGALHWDENILHLFKALLTYHIFWVLIIVHFKKLPLFLKRSILTIPLFILPHMVTGVIKETRQLIPLGFIIIPSAMLYVKNIISSLEKKYYKKKKLL